MSDKPQVDTFRWRVWWQAIRVRRGIRWRWRLIVYHWRYDQKRRRASKESA